MRKNSLFFTILLFLAATELKAQQLPVGTCGIVNVYDNAGNRVRRVYFCNNGTDPYPQKGQESAVELQWVVEKNDANTIYEQVESLFPNPTTGKFTVTFSKSIDRATVVIMDNTGRQLARASANGFLAEFDLSNHPAGVYFIRIEENGKIITKKVVKQ